MIDNDDIAESCESDKKKVKKVTKASQWIRRRKNQWSRQREFEEEKENQQQ